MISRETMESFCLMGEKAKKGGMRFAQCLNFIFAPHLDIYFYFLYTPQNKKCLIIQNMKWNRGSLWTFVFNKRKIGMKTTRNIVSLVVSVISINFKIFDKINAKIARGIKVLYSNTPKNFGE